MLIFREMTSQGTKVSADVHMRAYVQWARTPQMTYSALAADLCRALAADGIAVEGDHPMNRAADRMVQIFRKQGLIERDGSKWRLTYRGATLRTTIAQDISK